MCARELLGQAIDVVEITIRLVLVLLVQFCIIEAFITKLRRRWRSWLWTKGPKITCIGRWCFRDLRWGCYTKPISNLNTVE